MDGMSRRFDTGVLLEQSNNGSSTSTVGVRKHMLRASAANLRERRQ